MGSTGRDTAQLTESFSPISLLGFADLPELIMLIDSDHCAAMREAKILRTPLFARDELCSRALM